MPFVYNPTNGQILVTEGDPAAYFEQGYREPTLEELEQAKRVEDYGSFSQQAQAQAERVLRGATLGAVDGFGSDEENRARAEVSEELSPVTSMAASIAPDVGVALLTGGVGGLATGAGRAAGRAALAEGAGLVRAGLAAGRAGGAAALAAESAGTAAVGAGQQAYAEGRDLFDDPGKDAENALIWGGLNFGLGAAMFGAARRGARQLERETIETTGEELADVVAAAEVRAAPAAQAAVAEAAEAVPPTAAAPGIPSTAPAAAAPVELTEQEVKALNSAKSSIGSLERSRGPMKEAQASALEKLSTNDPGQLWRGMRLSEEQLQGIIDGGYELTKHTPSSVDRAAAETFAGGVDHKVPVLMQIDGAPRAVMAHGYPGDAFPKEQTAILFPGQRYKVVSVEDVTIPPEKDWMQPMQGKLLKLQGEAPAPVAAAELGAKTVAAAARVGELESIERGVERALRNASESEADELVDEALRQAPSSAKAGAKKGATPKAVEAPSPEGDSFGRQRRLYINRNAIYDVAEREMAADLGGLMKDMDQVTRAEKLSTVSSHVSENLAAQRAVAKGVSEDAAKLVGELRAEAQAYAKASGKKGLQYAIDGQQQLSLDLLEHAEQIMKASNGKGTFEALDALKRATQEHKLALEEGMINATNAIHHQKLIPRIDQFAQRVRVALEDSGTWGKAGAMQRDYNSIISDQLLPHMKVFERSVLERTSKGYDGVWNTEGWETKIRALLKGNDPGKVRHVNAVLDAMDELASVRRKYGDAATADRILQRTAKVRRTIGLADEVSDATGRMQALGSLIGGVPMGGAIAGGLAGGLPGAAIGAALPGAVRGLVMGDLIEAFRQHGARRERLGRERARGRSRRGRLGSIQPHPRTGNEGAAHAPAHRGRAPAAGRGHAPRRHAVDGAVHGRRREPARRFRPLARRAAGSAWVLQGAERRLRRATERSAGGVPRSRRPR